MNEASALAVNCHTSLCVLSHPKGERKKGCPNIDRGVLKGAWTDLHQIGEDKLRSSTDAKFKKN